MASNQADATRPITFTYNPNYDHLGARARRHRDHPLCLPSNWKRGALQVASVTGGLPGSQVDYAYDELGPLVRRTINGWPRE